MAEIKRFGPGQTPLPEPSIGESIWQALFEREKAAAVPAPAQYPPGKTPVPNIDMEYRRKMMEGMKGVK